MYQKKNKLKDLIYIQDNKLCNGQTIKGLFRSIVEPILDSNVESLVLCRFEEKSKKEFGGILKRLEYSNATIYDFSDSPIDEKFKNILKDGIWDKTEFVYVLANRFGAALIFDYEESELNGFAQNYTLYNSKNLSDVFEIINVNSTVDLKEYEEKWHPDRRENDILNSSIRKIVENLNETNQEILISELAKAPVEDDLDLGSRLEFISNKSNFVAHEIRNQLSICSLYSTIMQKQLNKVNFDDVDTEKSFVNAIDCVQKSIKIAGNLLLDLKSLTNVDLKKYDLNTLVETAVELAKVYASGKNIQIKTEISESATIMADENKFLAVLINLIKNAVESIGESAESGEDSRVGEIIIKTEINDENVKLTVSNNGKPIAKEIQEKIYEEGFTTKATGSGLGLAICRKSLEEQFAQLKLAKSDEVSTEFEISLIKA